MSKHNRQRRERKRLTKLGVTLWKKTFQRFAVWRYQDT